MQLTDRRERGRHQEIEPCLALLSFLSKKTEDTFQEIASQSKQMSRQETVRTRLPDEHNLLSFRSGDVLSVLDQNQIRTYMKVIDDKWCGRDQIRYCMFLFLPFHSCHPSILTTVLLVLILASRHG